MAKSSSTKRIRKRKKTSPFAVFLLFSLIASAAVGYGFFWWLNQTAMQRTEAEVVSVSQKVATLVAKHIDTLQKDSVRLSNDPSLNLQHAYPVRITKTLPTELNFSEQDYISRGRIAPHKVIPEMTLSKLPVKPNDTTQVKNVQALSVYVPSKNGQETLVRWSLTPLVEQLNALVPSHIHFVLEQRSNQINTQALSIHTQKSHVLEKNRLSSKGWSLTGSYDVQQQGISPLYMALGAFGGVFVLLAVLSKLLSRNKQVPTMKDVGTENDVQLTNQDTSQTSEVNDSNGVDSNAADAKTSDDSDGKGDQDVQPNENETNTAASDVSIDGAVSDTASSVDASSVDASSVDAKNADSDADLSKKVAEESGQSGTSADSNSTDDSQQVSEQITEQPVSLDVAEEMIIPMDDTGDQHSDHTTAQNALDDQDESFELLSELETATKSNKYLAEHVDEGATGSASSSSAGRAESAGKTGDVETDAHTLSFTGSDASQDVPDVDAIQAFDPKAQTAADDLDDGNVISFDGSLSTSPEVQLAKASLSQAQDAVSESGSTAMVEDNVDAESIRQVFRTFDIRGLATYFDAAMTSRIGKALASVLIQNNTHSVVMGYDVRKSSQAMCDALSQQLMDFGIQVTHIGMVTTPIMVYAASENDGAGIMITASHCAADQNGIKWVVNNQSPTPEDVLALHDMMQTQSYASPVGKGASKEDLSYTQTYKERLLSDIMLADLPNVVIDCMDGATSVVAESVIEESGCVVTVINNRTDGEFSSGNPNPTENKRLSALSKAVVEQGADIGFAFDCDGDRVGVVDELGQIVSSEKLLCLFASLLLETNPAADILYDIKCSRFVAHEITQQGGRPIVMPTGAYILRQALHDPAYNAVFAGELSGHYIFNDNRLGQHDDGVYAAMRLLEWLTQTGMPLSTHVAHLQNSVNSDDVYVAMAREKAEERVAECVSDWKHDTSADHTDVVLTEIDGFRLDFNQGFCLIRPSNTSNALTARISASDTASFYEIRDILTAHLQRIDPDIADAVSQIEVTG